MKIKKTKHISWQIYNNVVYIFDERKDATCKLEGAACEFWKKIMENKEMDVIAEELAQYYKVEKNIIVNDAKKFLCDLCELEVIEMEEQ